jgi:arylsulfatase A-like enzyme
MRFTPLASCLAPAVALAVALATTGGCGAPGAPAANDLPLACATDPPADLPPVATSLSELFPLAQVAAETGVLDLGAPEAQPALLGGWASPEAGAGVWGLGAGSEVAISIRRPSPRELVLHGVPFTFPGAPPQRVGVSLNGRPLGDLTLDAEGGARDYRLPVPASLQRRGVNRLRLAYAYARRPLDVTPGSQDARPLAVFWTGLELVGGRDYGAPTAARGDLTLPFDTAVSYALRMPEGGVLTLAGIRRWGGKRSQPARGDLLEVRVALAGGGGETACRIALAQPRPDGWAVRIPPSPAGPARVTLLPLFGGPPPAEAAGLRLVRPHLHTAAPVLEPRPPAPPAPAPQRPRRPDVILYLVDALRADHLGRYGYRRPTSPNVDAFAADAVTFSRALAQAPWTRPAVASILTGLDSLAHGTLGREDSLSPAVTPLAEILSALGYRTLAVVSNGNVSPSFGFGRGFDAYRYLPEHQDTPEVHQLSDRVDEVALKLLAEPTRAPRLLYVHATDPHGPYVPRSPYRERFAPEVTDPFVGTLGMLFQLKDGHLAATPEVASELSDLYDAEIAFADAQFGRFLDRLKASGRYASSLIVFLADHGEEFRDHGYWEHGASLYDEQLHVPLIVKFPDGLGAGETVGGAVRQIDVLPTLLAYLGAPAPVGVQGRSLLPLVAAPATNSQPPPAFAYLDLDRQRMESVEVGDLKLIHVVEDGSAWLRGRVAEPGKLELYDLGSDPGEEHNLAAARPVWAGYLRTLLAQRRALGRRPAPTATNKVDATLRRRLQALGYLH